MRKDESPVQPGLSKTQLPAGSVGRRTDGAERLQAAKRAALAQWVREWYSDDDGRGTWAEHFGAPSLSDVYARDRGRQFDGFGQFTDRHEADAAVAALVDAGQIQLRARKGKVVLIPAEAQA
jgi:hypothetical protein